MRQRIARTCPSFNAALLNAEDEHRTGLDHGAALRIIETTGDARNNSLTSCVDEAESVDGSLNISCEWGHIWVACHRASLRQLDNGEVVVVG